MNALSLITRGFITRIKILIVESINIALSVNQPEIEIDIEDINADVNVSEPEIEISIEDIEVSVDIPGPEIEVNI